MKHMGFTYRQTMFHWIKVKKGKPASLPGTFSNTNVEELLVATKGDYHRYLRPGIKDLPE